jgi:hypothetical protein
MVRYDFRCENNHEFEGEFPNYDAYIKQLERNKIRCPICNTGGVEKIFSKVNVIKGGAQIERKEEKTGEPKTFGPKDYMNYLKEKFIDVGEKFPEEAREMHYHKEDYREEKLKNKDGIVGACSDEEREELLEEGIKVAKIPIIKFDA